MKHNGPVTQREFALEPGATLVSATDLDSRITYANPAFVAASGFTREQLIGQPHHLIRHPDMPAEAFRDLWATLKSGRPWSGLVKNRRRDGDHYWVRANVTPVREHGRVAGYMSVRTCPTRAEVQAAEALYARLRDDAARPRPCLALREGRLVRRGPRGWLQRALAPGLPTRIGVAGFAVPLGVALAATAWPGAWTLGAGALAGLVLAAWLRRAALAPLAQAVQSVERMAAGDLGAHAVPPCDARSGRLQRGLAQLHVSLQAVVGDVRREVDGLHGASREIRGGNGDLAGRTESQASSLEQTAAALEQITATIRANAEAAQGAFATASEAASVAERGGAAAAEAAHCMQEIAAASARIGDIIGTVDGIAFQTRMLSLNAAVEATRAGEAGRGFAVVASEVRALAQRTSDAAREVRELIGAASARIAAGSALVQATGETAQGTVAAVQRVNALLDDIRRASAEQAAGVTQVNGAVAGLDAITQQNAALVQQLAASAGTLEGRAAEVAQAVRIFRTECAAA